MPVSTIQMINPNTAPLTFLPTGKGNERTYERLLNV